VPIHVVGRAGLPPGLDPVVDLFVGRFISGLIPGFQGAFEFVRVGLSGHVYVINEFLPKVGLPLKEIVA
jgi:hypothetical protein